MQKCWMWKTDTNNEPLPRSVTQWIDTRKKYIFKIDIKRLIETDSEVKKVIVFLIEIEMFKEI